MLVIESSRRCIIGKMDVDEIIRSLCKEFEGLTGTWLSSVPGLVLESETMSFAKWFASYESDECTNGERDPEEEASSRLMTTQTTGVVCVPTPANQRRDQRELDLWIMISNFCVCDDDKIVETLFDLKGFSWNRSWCDLLRRYFRAHLVLQGLTQNTFSRVSSGTILQTDQERETSLTVCTGRICWSKETFLRQTRMLDVVSWWLFDRKHNLK